MRGEALSSIAIKSLDGGRGGYGFLFALVSRYLPILNRLIRRPITFS
ncbi:hypothetical protein SAMN02745166_04392 [Prosthecobacter debontii]|uniref:Uncharacterized protein n=1 Tax=Prosthecobacter debontii TaxID=48467 RepID=A0A1T4YVX4_9BACT|nr:hypothetical protein SAMN02745166_04392 [Prosthecobacter debontii]